ncbi:uncharacterized protein METZ01_LOCUS122221, partial [marine metagenome]
VRGPGCRPAGASRVLSRHRRGRLAQLVEHHVHIVGVAGSSPAATMQRHSLSERVMKCESSLVLVLLFTLLLPVGAQAQSPGASPTYGDVGLSAGFDQDPSTKHGRLYLRF